LKSRNYQVIAFYGPINQLIFETIASFLHFFILSFLYSFLCPSLWQSYSRP
jgi:hypothetical protein